MKKLLKNYMASQKNNNLDSHNIFLRLAFEKAKINLGKTDSNPSVGCILVKNKSVISSACTSAGGRPHAEYNALKFKKKFEKTDLYVTMEPCVHYGITPPCTTLIRRKGIKRVFYAFDDIDERTSKKSKKILTNKNIKVKQIQDLRYQDFYHNYFFSRKNNTPYIDAKIAISKDYFTIKKKGSKWITNRQSRNRTHLLRSQYDAILSTSKSINQDNSLLNCRLSGFNTNKPDLIIIDLNFEINKKLTLFRNKKKRRILIITSNLDKKKIIFFKKIGVKIIFIKSLKEKRDFMHLFKILNKHGYNKLLVESGLSFLNTLLKDKLIFNLYVFKSSKKLGRMGFNNTTKNLIKKMSLNNKIKVNLNGDKLYKVKLR